MYFFFWGGGGGGGGGVSVAKGQQYVFSSLGGIVAGSMAGQDKWCVTCSILYNLQRGGEGGFAVNLIVVW